MGPGDLHALVADVAAASAADPGVLVGLATGDDAGVYALPAAELAAAARDGLGVVSTADYITPPFDDPEAYGRIAAANALSDVYAMGGRPLCALNLCVFPKELDAAVAREILRGAAAVLAEAGAALVGGHTVRGPELLFGLSVTGVVAPARIWRNVGAQAGDVLLLTKPLGSGLIVSGARRRPSLVAEAERAGCAAAMAQLNRRAAEVLAAFSVHAATDVTGFGLVGHALGMTGAAAADAIALAIRVADLPCYPGALALAARGVTCAGARANRAAYAPRIAVHGTLTAAYEELIYDPQTSGGLLCALPAAEAPAALRALAAAGVAAAGIGEVLPRDELAALAEPDAALCIRA